MFPVCVYMPVRYFLMLFSLVDRETLCQGVEVEHERLNIHPESALWFYTVSVFRALCTSATNIVGLNWFANIVNKKQHYLLVTPCILLKLNHNAAIILFHWKEYAGPPRKIKRFYPLNPAEKIQHCNVACQVKSRSLCSAL